MAKGKDKFEDPLKRGRHGKGSRPGGTKISGLLSEIKHKAPQKGDKELFGAFGLSPTINRGRYKVSLKEIKKTLGIETVNFSDETFFTWEEFFDNLRNWIRMDSSGNLKRKVISAHRIITK